MKLPCERAIWYVLPRIRADIAKELVRGGMSQREAAEKLGVTAAAVSQYLNKKRGSVRESPRVYRRMITESARRIKDQGDEEAVSRILCRCCAKSR